MEVLDHTVAVRPTGEVDIETAPPLRFAMAEALAHASPARAVVVDCSGLTFCDSSALNALLAARRAAQETGTVIRLAAPNPPAPAPPGDHRHPDPLPRGPGPSGRPQSERMPGRTPSVGGLRVRASERHRFPASWGTRRPCDAGHAEVTPHPG
ncbi:STAS domain-containing protein [Streptomyces sp. NPDC001549]|uniref:STAS domain-containing protein n=1 Tax=Streptomyces sp. NPDC001549 TaxID=3364586 RepID=UPI0036AAA4F1